MNIVTYETEAKAIAIMEEHEAARRELIWACAYGAAYSQAIARSSSPTNDVACAIAVQVADGALATLVRRRAAAMEQSSQAAVIAP